jgi:hypothetical protein
MTVRTIEKQKMNKGEGRLWNVAHDIVKSEKTTEEKHKQEGHTN